MKAHFLLLAGGSGNRVGGSTPKQLLPLAGVPLVGHSLLAFARYERAARIVISARADLVRETEQVARKLLSADRSAVPLLVVAGGATRHGSAVAAARAASDQVPAEDVVLIHDAARPFVSPAEFDRLLECFADPKWDTASLVSPVHETIVRGHVAGAAEAIVDRDQLLAVKTPQALRGIHLNRFVQTPDDPRLTDLISWALAEKLTCRLVSADADNQKLTTAEDVSLFEAIAARRARLS